MLLLIYLHSQHLHFSQQASYSGFWKLCKKLLHGKGTWTIRKARMVADHEKQIASYTCYSSERSNSCHICLKGLHKACSVEQNSPLHFHPHQLMTVNNLKANPSLPMGRGREDGKVHSKPLLHLSQVDKHNAMITLCAEVHSHVPLTQA